MLPNLEMYGDVYFIPSWNLWSNTIWPNAKSTSLAFTPQLMQIFIPITCLLNIICIL